MMLKIIIAVSLSLLIGTKQIFGNPTGNYTDTLDVGTKIVRPAVTRAELKVSRSLNPDNVQQLNVKTNDGGVATIIVKKRDGKASTLTSINGNSEQPRLTQYYDSSNRNLRRDDVKRGLFGPVTVLERIKSDNQQQTNTNYATWSLTRPASYRFAVNDQQQNSADIINEFIKHVNNIEKTGRQYSEESSIKNDRRPVRIAVTSTDVDTKSEQPKSFNVPAPVFVRSDTIYTKDQNGKTSFGKRGRSIKTETADGIPVIEGVRVPDDESDKVHTWRNARVINGELVPYEKNYVPPKLESTIDNYGQLIFAKKPEPEKRSIGPFTKADNYQATDRPKSFGPFSVEDNLKPSNQILFESPDTVRSNTGFGPFSRADNSRMSNAKLIEYIRKINDKESKKYYFAGRANRELGIGGEQPKIQRRMLQNPGNPIYPISSLYSIGGAQNNDIPDGRTPVLQYAHPELGVQPAKAINSDEKSNNPNNGKTKLTKIEYYSKSVHNDHSPYAIEPAMNTNEYYKQPPQPDMYKPFVNPATYPYNYGFIRRVKQEPSFWVKITEHMKDSFQNGFTTVQEITRPVFDPIMEAGEKISKNLGFTRQDEAENKVGIVTPASTSIILPLGLLAGGAALGLGAVAVGRFFDVGLLKRSGSDHFLESEMDMEHKRTLATLNQNPENLYFLIPDDSNNAEQQQRQQSSSRNKRNIFDTQNVFEIVSSESTDVGGHRSRRSVDSAANENESLASILQDVEQDMPKSTRVGFEQQIKNTDWKNTPCAKKAFCEVMIKQNSDDIVLMEKKMYTLLGMMHPTLGASLTQHLSEVTDAIRQHDCSQFHCYQRR
uniref:Putative conserved secreted protein n=1 Tax=Corethrella appendiculata TaxID=1370023 RepID=U5ELC6_9DIPT